MGSRYQCQCLDCQYKFTLIKGGGWTWFQKVCAVCGVSKNIPRKGPANFVEGKTLTSEELLHHINTPSLWSRHGGAFDYDENKVIYELTSTCECGGELIPEWDSRILYRCPHRRSEKINLTKDLLFD